jgi:hypothetical protein
VAGRAQCSLKCLQRIQAASLLNELTQHGVSTIRSDKHRNDGALHLLKKHHHLSCRLTTLYI